MGSCIDLRKWQDSSSIQEAYSKLVSGGRPGYKAFIERKKDLPKCQHCPIEGQCNGCSQGILNEQKFCADCGHKLN